LRPAAAGGIVMGSADGRQTTGGNPIMGIRSFCEAATRDVIESLVERGISRAQAERAARSDLAALSSAIICFSFPETVEWIAMRCRLGQHAATEAVS